MKLNENMRVRKYWTTQLINKIIGRIGRNLRTARATGGKESDVHKADVSLVQGLISELGITVDELFPELFPESSKPAPKKTKAKKENTPPPEEDPELGMDEGDEDDVEETDSEFDDRLHAIESMDLPDTAEECLTLKKKRMLELIYSGDHESAIEYLGLPVKRKDCNGEYTHKALVEFLFKED